MIVFFRHGKTKWNLEQRLQGKEFNSELLPVDKSLIENIKDDFFNIHFDKILVSPLKRAQDYSKILNLKSCITETRTDIAEISFGILSGKKLSEIDKKIIDERNHDKWNYRPLNGESYNDLYNRLKKLSSELLNKNGNIAIIAHETSNKVLIGILMNYDKDSIIKLKQPNDTIYKIENNIYIDLNPLQKKYYITFVT